LNKISCQNNQRKLKAVLNQNEIGVGLKKLSGWSYENDQIGKEFKFKDFKSALEFVNKVGDEAEKMNHHPDIFLHSWNKVKLTVSTHSVGGVTEKDFTLAGNIESLNK
jgi:4a-hydroxytetrahydrobiopterin dehydratase